MIASMPGFDTRTDLELVAAANGGSRDAFAALYERHRRFVHSVAWRLVGDVESADEIVQEVFLWWLGRFPGFVLSSKATTFLYTLTRSRAIDVARRRRRTLRMPEDADAIPQPMRDAGAALGQDIALAAAVDQLPFGQQEVLLLRFGHDLSIEEIAQALGVPLGTVKSRLHAAMKVLKENGIS